MIEPIDYHAMRMLRFRAALVDFLRRWGAYLGIALLVFSAGSNAPLTIASATTSALLWPMRDAALHGWAIVPMTLAYGVVGALPVLLTRPLWWPARWAQSERALPLDAVAIRRSDRRFAVVLMAPWHTLLLLGGAGAWWHEPAARTLSTWSVVLVAASIAALLSLTASLWWMRFARRSATASWRIVAAWTVRSRVRRGWDRTVDVVGPGRALVLLPLVRRRAPRSAVATIGGAVATMFIGLALPSRGVSIGWTAALLALLSIAATSAARAATVRELQPLWRDHRALPLNRRVLDAMRTGVVLVPMAVAVAAFVAAACAGPAPIRDAVLAGYAATLAVGCAIEATTHPAMTSSNHAARWILLLAITIAVGSEITPS